MLKFEVLTAKLKFGDRPTSNHFKQMYNVWLSNNHHIDIDIEPAALFLPIVSQRLEKSTSAII